MKEIVLLSMLVLSFNLAFAEEKLKCSESEAKVSGNEECKMLASAQGFGSGIGYGSVHGNLDNEEIEEFCFETIGNESFKIFRNTTYEDKFISGCAKGLKYKVSDTSKIKVSELYSRDDSYIFDKHQIYTNFTKNIKLTSNITKNEIFFGEREKFKTSTAFNSEAFGEFAVDGLINGLNSGVSTFAKGMTTKGLQHGVAGLGIGLVFGLIDTAVKYNKNKKFDEEMKKFENKEYLLVEEITNSKNEKTKKFTLLVVQHKSKISIDEIKEKMKGI